ncbi:MAG: DUF4190 domain-containing protein [Thermoleophilia bacterium]|nr:DUF4190 domain-containing protein [Thermoleophilia bacterium]
MPVSRPTNQTAIWALVCSILGVTCCGLLSIVGLVLSASAKREIELSGGATGGEGLAKAAWIVGWVGSLDLVDLWHCRPARDESG